MLTAEQAQHVRATIWTTGWREVIHPSLQNRGAAALKALRLNPSERAVEFKGTEFEVADDYFLRAIIRDIEWMLGIWDKELAVYDHNRRLDELDRQNSPVNGEPVRS